VAGRLRETLAGEWRVAAFLMAARPLRVAGWRRAGEKLSFGCTCKKIQSRECHYFPPYITKLRELSKTNLL
jgi:hypothetical protein